MLIGRELGLVKLKLVQMCRDGICFLDTTLWSLSCGFSTKQKDEIPNSTHVCQAPVSEAKRARGDVPEILPEPEAEPTSPVSDFENSYNYVCESLGSHPVESSCFLTLWKTSASFVSLTLSVIALL